MSVQLTVGDCADWPAIVQAVGSIVAIIVAAIIAVAVPMVQRWLEVRATRRAAAEAAVQAAKWVWTLVAALDNDATLAKLSDRGFPKLQFNAVDDLLNRIPLQALAAHKALILLTDIQITLKMVSAHAEALAAANWPKAERGTIRRGAEQLTEDLKRFCAAVHYKLDIKKLQNS